MTTRPVIFISSVSKELHTARDLVAKTLHSLGYDPKWEDTAPTDQGPLLGILRKWIDDSAAVIQLVGHCYGLPVHFPSPSDPTNPSDPSPFQFGPCSHTQYEALYARQQHKPIYYILIEATHPTDGCTCSKEPQPLHDLQQTYRLTVKSYGDLYHSSSSLKETELLVRCMEDKLAHLRRRNKQHAALVLGLLVVLVLGGALLIQSQSESKQKIEGLSQQNDKLLQALRDLPQTLSLQPRTDAKEDETIRIARAYSELETQLKIPPGSLAKELPQFAQQLLQRADTSALDRANALFATQKFVEAEAEALKAKDHALASAGQHAQDAIDALLLAGQSAQAQIHYPQAMDYYLAASALTSLKRDVLQWLAPQNSISWLRYLQGHYSEGLAHAQQVWQTAKQARQDEAPAVLIAHMLYAVALDANGQAATAEPEYRAVIQVYDRVLGAEHRRTWATRNNLARALFAQARFAEAEQELRAVLTLSERILGAEHPVTLSIRMNLASVLQAQTKYAEAEITYRAGLKLQEHALGTEHPNTLSIRNNLAVVLKAQAKYAEAGQEHHAVLKLQERVLGAEHPETLISRSNLAVVLKAQGKYSEAEQEYRAVIELQERVMGAEHPDTLRSRMNLANALQSQSKYAEAEQEQRAVLKLQERVLGVKHSDTLKSRMNLANALQSQGNNAEAEQEQRAVLKLQERVLGAEHPDTLKNRMDLANTLQSQGKNAEAVQVYFAVIELQKRMLGAANPDTLKSRMNLANALQSQSKYAEAEQEQRAVLKLQERVLGVEHPDTVLSCYNLACCLEAQRKFPEAVGLMQQAEQVWTKVLGPEHPHVKSAKNGRERLETAQK
jgi:tetratricopeptide (TPR) repeat protein